MEWRDSFLDLALIPLSLLLPMAYHVWLWREVRLRPLRTAAGINAAARRVWAVGMMKVRAVTCSYSPIRTRTHARAASALLAVRSTELAAAAPRAHRPAGRQAGWLAGYWILRF